MILQHNRILRITITIGITLIVVSLIGSGRFGFQSSVNTGAYEGYLFRTTGDIYVTASSLTSQNFSLYILDSENILMVLENSTLKDTVQVFALENIAQYSGIIDIPSIGVYAVLVASFNNDTISVNVEISRSYPVPGLLMSGVVLLVVSLLMNGISFPYERMQRKRKFSGDEKTRIITPGRKCCGG